MKYFILFLSAFVFVSVHAATTISVTETDLAKAEAAIKDPKDTYSKFIATCVKNCIVNNYVNFDDMYQMVRKEVAVLAENNKYYTPEKLEHRAALVAKCLTHVRPHLRKGAFGLTTKYPDYYDLGMYMTWAEHGLSDADLYTTLVKYLTKFHAVARPDLVLRAVNKVIELGATVDTITTQKQDLQKLNRIYSQKVLKDKESWEPVCSQIRTAIDTY